MTKPTFITESQLAKIAESICGSCYTLTHYFSYYQEEFKLTDDQMQELEDIHVPAYHAENEIFLCDRCNWWSHPGEVSTELGNYLSVCDDCMDVCEEEEDEEE